MNRESRYREVNLTSFNARHRSSSAPEHVRRYEDEVPARVAPDGPSTPRPGKD